MNLATLDNPRRLSLRSSHLTDVDNNKIFRNYTGTFFKEYKIVPSPNLSKPFVIKGKKILVGKMEILKLIEALLKLTGKTCDELIAHMDVMKLSDGRELVKAYPKRFLTNTANSCAIDSIIFILFFTQRSFFMDKIYQSTTSETPRGKEFKQKVLPLLTDLYTSFEKWTGTASVLQKAIFPFITATSCADVKSGTEIWSMFANAFDKLQFDFLSEREREIGNKPAKRTYLDLQDDPDPMEIRFDQPEFLIYGDDRRPVTQDLRPLHDLKAGDYELKAVLFFDSGHYTCAVKTLTNWVYYDDLLGGTRLLKTPEKFIFNERPSHKIQMLFYTR